MQKVDLRGWLAKCSAPQDLPKFFSWYLQHKMHVFFYTQFQYIFESDLRLLDVTKPCKTQFISTCIHPNCPKTTCFQRFLSMWVLPLQTVSNFTKNLLNFLKHLNIVYNILCTVASNNNRLRSILRDPETKTKELPTGPTGYIYTL